MFFGELILKDAFFPIQSGHTSQHQKQVKDYTFSSLTLTNIALQPSSELAQCYLIIGDKQILILQLSTKRNFIHSSLNILIDLRDKQNGQIGILSKQGSVYLCGNFALANIDKQIQIQSKQMQNHKAQNVKHNNNGSTQPEKNMLKIAQVVTENQTQIAQPTPRQSSRLSSRLREKPLPQLSSNKQSNKQEHKFKKNQKQSKKQSKISSKLDEKVNNSQTKYKSNPNCILPNGRYNLTSLLSNINDSDSSQESDEQFQSGEQQQSESSSSQHSSSQSQSKEQNQFIQRIDMTQTAATKSPQKSQQRLKQQIILQQITPIASKSQQDNSFINHQKLPIEPTHFQDVKLSQKLYSFKQKCLRIQELAKSIKVPTKEPTII